MYYQPKKRIHRIDGWRSYIVPANAVAGASDTGMWEDSPCPSDKVAREVRKFRKTVLAPIGVKSRVRFGTSSNLFCGKRWIVVSPEDFDKAANAVAIYLAEHDRDLRYVHDADLDQCEVPPQVSGAGTPEGQVQA